jgi:hypothetical protein
MRYRLKYASRPATRQHIADLALDPVLTQGRKRELVADFEAAASAE